MLSQLFQTIQHIFHPQRSNNHRPRILHTEALALLLFFVFGTGLLFHSLFFLQPLGSILGYASDISAVQVLASTNAERAKAGLSELQFNSALTEAALAKGQDMFSNQYWAHTSPTGKEPWAFIGASGYEYSVAGENLARDFDTTPAMMNAWMNSPTHRANIVHQKYSEIGIAVIHGNLHGVDTTLVVQMFGAPSKESSLTQKLVPEVQAVTQEADVTTQGAGSDDTIESTRAVAELATVVIQDSLEREEAVVDQESGVPQLRTAVEQRTITTQTLIAPQLVLKSIFLAVVLVILSVLLYDHAIIGHRRATRVVGDNIGHILLFSLVLVLMLTIKTGSIL